MATTMPKMINRRQPPYPRKRSRSTDKSCQYCTLPGLREALEWNLLEYPPCGCIPKPAPEHGSEAESEVSDEEMEKNVQSLIQLATDLRKGTTTSQQGSDDDEKTADVDTLEKQSLERFAARDRRFRATVCEHARKERRRFHEMGRVNEDELLRLWLEVDDEEKFAAPYIAARRI